MRFFQLDSVRAVCVCFFLALGLSACGDGDGGGLPGADDGADGAGRGGELNPGLSGVFFYGLGGYTWLADAATGQPTRLFKIDYKERTDLFPSGKGAVAISAGYDREELLVYSIKCHSGTGTGTWDEWTACYRFQGMDGSYRPEGFDVRHGRTPYLSRDRQYVAVEVYASTTGSSDQWLHLYDRQGNLIERSQTGDGGADGIDWLAWLPDGRMVYTKNQNPPLGGDRYDRTFYFTYPYSTKVAYRVPLPAEVPGKMEDAPLQVSPDGRQLAFMVVPAEGWDNNSVVWMMEDQGDRRYTFRKLAQTAGRTDNQSLASWEWRRQGWSPDGKWLLIFDGTEAWNIPWGKVGRVTEYLVPTEDMGKVFLLSRDESQRSPEVRIFYHYEKKNGKHLMNQVVDRPYNAVWLP